jgi:regulator of replication initiation timing
MRRVFSVALLALCLSCFLFSPAQAQSSPPILPGSETLWQSLNQIALTLPNSYDSFMNSLTGQINSLQTSNQDLQASNAQLTDSNSSLTLRNADLTNSLTISLQAAETSESKSTLLQKALDASSLSITQLESDAKALKGWNTFWKVTTGVGILGTVAAVVWALVK